MGLNDAIAKRVTRIADNWLDQHPVCQQACADFKIAVMQCAADLNATERKELREDIQYFSDITIFEAIAEGRTFRDAVEFGHAVLGPHGRCRDVIDKLLSRDVYGPDN